MDHNDRAYASFASFSLGDLSDWSETSDFDLNESSDSLPVDVLEELLPRKVVRFGSVHVRTHKVTLGDNPSCSKGAPLALAWNAIQIDRFSSLEEFERVFGSPKQVQKVSVQVREQWLQDNGHSIESMKVAVREIETAKKERSRSIATSDRCADIHQQNDVYRLTTESATKSKSRDDRSNEIPLLPRRQKTPPLQTAKLRV